MFIRLYRDARESTPHCFEGGLAMTLPKTAGVPWGPNLYVVVGALME